MQVAQPDTDLAQQPLLVGRCQSFPAARGEAGREALRLEEEVGDRSTHQLHDKSGRTTVEERGAEEADDMRMSEFLI